MKKDIRFTVGQLKAMLKKYNVPDNALVCCQSDEEGNREMVCCDMFIDQVGTKELWQELITTKKALDVALDVLKEIQDKGEYVNPIDMAESALEQITTLKQKEQQ